MVKLVNFALKASGRRRVATGASVKTADHLFGDINAGNRRKDHPCVNNHAGAGLIKDLLQYRIEQFGERAAGFDKFALKHFALHLAGAPRLPHPGVKSADPFFKLSLRRGIAQRGDIGFLSFKAGAKFIQLFAKRHPRLPFLRRQLMRRRALPKGALPVQHQHIMALLRRRRKSGQRNKNNRKNPAPHSET